MPIPTVADERIRLDDARYKQWMDEFLPEVEDVVAFLQRNPWCRVNGSPPSLVLSDLHSLAYDFIVHRKMARRALFHLLALNGVQNMTESLRKQTETVMGKAFGHLTYGIKAIAGALRGTEFDYVPREPNDGAPRGRGRPLTRVPFSKFFDYVLQRRPSNYIATRINIGGDLAKDLIRYVQGDLSRYVTPEMVRRFTWVTKVLTGTQEFWGVPMIAGTLRTNLRVPFLISGLPIRSTQRSIPSLRVGGQDFCCACGDGSDWQASPSPSHYSAANLQSEGTAVALAR